MKIGVIGANGQLGVDICQAFSKHEVVPLNHQDIPMENEVLIRRVLENLKPQVVINTSAYHQLDLCEKNPVMSFAVNALGPKTLAMLSRELGFKLVHFSTDYVFNGFNTTPYVEISPTRPLNVYGVSKLAGECFIDAHAPNALIIRTASLFGKSPCRAKNGLNFVQLMLKLAREGKPISVVDDQFSSPTNTADLAEQTLKLVEADVVGLRHVVNEGGCSWFEYATEIIALSGIMAQVTPKKTVLAPDAVRRPSYSVMETIYDDARMPHWKDALKRYLST